MPKKLRKKLKTPMKLRKVKSRPKPEKPKTSMNREKTFLNKNTLNLKIKELKNSKRQKTMPTKKLKI